MVGEKAAIADLGTAGDLAQGALPVAASDRSAPAGCAAAGGRAGAFQEVLSGLDGPTRRAPSVADRLDRQAGAARLVTHHEFLSSWLLRGSLGVLALVVVAHHRGRFVARSLASPLSWSWC
jgi:hypothetical protein